jgi:hypothetical protein
MIKIVRFFYAVVEASERLKYFLIGSETIRDNSTISPIAVQNSTPTRRISAKRCRAPGV